MNDTERRGGDGLSSDAGAASSPFAGQCSARIKRVRRGAFVEFEFSIGDGSLSLELIMPPAAFTEFCARHRAVVIQADPDRQAPAGLYRPPEERDEHP